MAKEYKVASDRPAHRRGMSPREIREERRNRSNRRKRLKRNLLTIGGGLAAIVLIVAVVIPTTFIGGGGGSHAGILQDESATINVGSNIIINNTTAGHTDTVRHTGRVGNYATVPATSGPRYQSSNVLLPGGQQVTAPPRWGRYDFPLPDEVLVGNLEYGGIGLHYDCPDGCDDIVEQLDDIRPQASVLSPYPGLQANVDSMPRIAITGWIHILYLDEFDEERIQDFIDSYLNRGPLPISANTFAIRPQ